MEQKHPKGKSPEKAIGKIGGDGNMKFLRKMKFDTVMISSVYVTLGVLILLWPEETQSYIGYIIALLLIAVGICFSVDYMRRDTENETRTFSMALSLLALAAGVTAFVHADEIIAKLNLVLSFLVLFSGFMKLQNTWDMKKLGYSKVMVHAVLSLISIVIGVVLLLELFEEADRTRLIGSGLIYGGFTDLISVFALAKAGKEANREKTEN